MPREDSHYGTRINKENPHKIMLAKPLPATHREKMLRDRIGSWSLSPYRGIVGYMGRST
jgi:hypothetical protein